MANLVNLTSGNWSSEVAGSPETVIVVCWSPWSESSRQLLPVISSLADSTSSSAKFGKLDADTETSLASQLQISALPQVLAIQKGQLQTRILGAQTKAYYQKVLKI
jgi:thioredoxin-like negative regulator of GroEL